MLRHVAMFKFREGVTEEQKVASRDALANLKGTVPSLREMTVGRNLEHDLYDRAVYQELGHGPGGGLRRPRGARAVTSRIPS